MKEKMPKKKPKGREYWEKELMFLRQKAEEKEFSIFNDDPEMFRRYVHMQVYAAKQDGFLDISGKLEGCIPSQGDCL